MELSFELYIFFFKDNVFFFIIFESSVLLIIIVLLFIFLSLGIEMTVVVCLFFIRIRNFFIVVFLFLLGFVSYRKLIFFK